MLFKYGRPVQPRVRQRLGVSDGAHLKSSVNVKPNLRDDNREYIVQDKCRKVDRPLSIRDCHVFTPVNHSVANPLNGPDLLPQRLNVTNALEKAKVDTGKLVEDSKQEIAKLVVALLRNEFSDQRSERLFVYHAVKNRLQQ